MSLITNTILAARWLRRGALLMVLCILVISTLGAAWASSSASYVIQPSVVASGGAAASSANYSITSTAGQPATGQAASASYSLCSGFWCGVQLSVERLLFLPLVKR